MYFKPLKALLFLTLLLFFSLHPVVAQSSKPNVLFIAIDDLNTWLNIYETYPEAYTPNIDALAARGMVFDNAFTTASLCNASRTSFVTGLRPSSTGVISNLEAQENWRTYMNSATSVARRNYGAGAGNITTIFQHFHNNDYYIGATGKIFHNNNQAAAETWDAFYPRQEWNFPRNKLNGIVDAEGNDPFHDGGIDWGNIALLKDDSGVALGTFNSPEYANVSHTIRMLRAARTQQPFFISTGFFLPHAPLFVPKIFLDLYAPNGDFSDVVLPTILEDDLADTGWYQPDKAMIQYVFRNPEQHRRLVAHYLAAISYVDFMIGRIMREVYRLNLDENTIIVLWSDHGLSLGEKDTFAKNNPWVEANQIPLIIATPQMSNAGQRSDAMVSSIDLFPTLVELTGLSMPTDFPRDGRSLIPVLQDPQTVWPFSVLSSNAQLRVSLRTKRWSLIDNQIDVSAPYQLYDRINDPHEWRNLLSPLNSNPALYQDLKNELLLVLAGQNLPNQAPSQIPKAQRIDNTIVYDLRTIDPNRDALIARIVQAPQQGTLMNATNQPLSVGTVFAVDLGMYQIKYNPTQSLTGADSFILEVSDGAYTRQLEILIPQSFDVNQDGVFTPSDVIWVINRLGQSLNATNSRADINRDGLIDNADVDVMLSDLSH